MPEHKISDTLPRYGANSSPSATQERPAPSNACNRWLIIPPWEGFAVSSLITLNRFRISLRNRSLGRSPCKSWVVPAGGSWYPTWSP